MTLFPKQPMITDAHTHHQERMGAVINSSFQDFKPQAGLFYSLGIHPWDIIAGCDLEKNLKAVETLAAECEQVVAIGECGVDSLTTAPIEVQLKVFERHIELSERLRKPLIIHSVRSSNDIMASYRKHKPVMPWVIHGFRSNVNVLRTFLSGENIYISVGEKFCEEAVKSIPEERLLIETDESLLPIESIAERVAKVRNQSVEGIMNLILKNLGRCVMINNLPVIIDIRS